MSDFVNTVDSVGDEALAGSIIDRSITEILDNYVTSIGDSAFDGCSSLTTVDFPAAVSISSYAFSGCSRLTIVDLPAATSIGGHAFSDCRALTTANFPAATSIDSYAFSDCSNLTTANLPSVAGIGGNAFNNCSKLTTVDLSSVGRIGSRVFYNCSKLTSLILRSGVMATLASTNAFSGTPIASGTGYIYVPAALVDSYKAANNWSTYANQFRSLEGYTVDGTTTGALDAGKI